MATIEADLFEFLTRVYVQHSDERQALMGLQYTTAETHDLAKQISRFVEDRFLASGLSKRDL